MGSFSVWHCSSCWPSCCCCSAVAARSRRSWVTSAGPVGLQEGRGAQEEPPPFAGRQTGRHSQARSRLKATTRAGQPGPSGRQGLTDRPQGSRCEADRRCSGIDEFRAAPLLRSWRWSSSVSKDCRPLRTWGKNGWPRCAAWPRVSAAMSTEMVRQVRPRRGKEQLTASLGSRPAVRSIRTKEIRSHINKAAEARKPSPKAKACSTRSPRCADAGIVACQIAAKRPPKAPRTPSRHLPKLHLGAETFCRDGRSGASTGTRAARGAGAGKARQGRRRIGGQLAL